LRDSRVERHSAVQRIPRSHSSASLSSRSAVALSSWARASLRYRIARADAHGISNPKATEQGFRLCQQRRPKAFRENAPSLTGAKSGKELRWDYREPTLNIATESGNISVLRGICVERPRCCRDRPAPPESADQALASGLPRLGKLLSSYPGPGASPLLFWAGGNLAGICGVMLTTLTLPSEAWLLIVSSTRKNFSASMARPHWWLICETPPPRGPIQQPN
jgi:hypothetical protein